MKNKLNMSSKEQMGITEKKNVNFSKWYQQILIKAELIRYYDVSGCYILLPNSYSIWENIQKYLDYNFKKRGTKNVYFPLLITENNLLKEQDHIQGFEAEVAWITNSSIENEKHKDRIAIRPTSETGMYSTYSDLIQSYADLPLKFNQWNNVLRWEFKDPTPFIRSREFLWQEGHTAFSTQAEAILEVQDIIDLYKYTYENLLCVPVIKGRKTENEKFAGAVSTYTIETFIPEIGKGIQCATAHNLGQNFSKMFNIQFQDKDGKNVYVEQNSWGFTTRSIGVMLMTTGDDQGPIIPPKVAPTQIVIIPILFSNSKDLVEEYVGKLSTRLGETFRIHIDRRNHNPGWKFNYWEMMGVPLRIEVGPRDSKNGTITIVRRDNRDKILIPFDEQLEIEILSICNNINSTLLIKARNNLKNSITYPGTRDQFEADITDKKMCLISWCDVSICEENIKALTSAKSLCIPNDSDYFSDITLNDESKCIYCGQVAKVLCLFGKSY